MQHEYSYGQLIRRLLKKASSIRHCLVISASASVTGSASRMGLMGFGAMWILCAYGYADGSSVFYASAAVLCGALIAVCRYLEGVYSHRGAYGLLAEMRVQLFQQISMLSPALMTERDTGDILNMAVGDIEQLEFFFAHMIGPMITVILLPVICLILAFHYNALFGWILLPAYFLASVIIPLAALRAGRSIGSASRRSQADLKSSILESIYGARDIQIFSAEDIRMKDMMEKNKRVNRAAHGLKLHRSLLSSVPDFIVWIVRILLIGAGGWLALRGNGNPAGTVVLSFASSASFSSTFSLTNVVTNLLETFASAERIFSIEDMKPAVEEADNPVDIGSIDTVAFNNVSFSYPGSDQKTLDHVSFVIHKGERIGVTGDSGAGKSTILRLLLRYYDPHEGEIDINGVDLKKISLVSLHRHIAMMEQDTFLFDDTIRANIAMGRENASEEEIRTAAADAGADEFIQTIPEGYDARMGALNSRLSGGERQRIGIARLLLRNPDLMVLDEPTSSLDVIHEKELLHTLHEQTEEKTVIMISHRRSTLAGCTRILHLENGKITEEKSA